MNHFLIKCFGGRIGSWLASVNLVHLGKRTPAEESLHPNGLWANL